MKITDSIQHLPSGKHVNKRLRPPFNNPLCRPYARWLPLNYSFVLIQNSLTNLVRDDKFFTIFVSKTRLGSHFCIGFIALNALLQINA